MNNIVDYLMASDSKIIKHLRLMNPTATDKENYFYFENKNSNMLLLAHLDTVRHCDVEVMELNDVLFNKHGILGADDRAGMYLALKNLVRFNVLITNYEETGGMGMHKFIMDDIKLDHVDLIIALDRRGCNEYVTYDTMPIEVCSYIEDFGFHQEHGSYNDCADLTEDTGIPHLNISVGYYDQHTKSETLDLMVLDITEAKLDMIADNPIDKRYTVERSYNSRNSLYNPRGLSTYWDQEIDERLEQRAKELFEEEWVWGTCDQCGETWKRCCCGQADLLLEANFTEDELYDLYDLLYVDYR